MRVFDLSADDAPGHVVFGRLAFQIDQLSPTSVVALQQVLNGHRGQLTKACLADIVIWATDHATKQEGRLRLLLSSQADREGRRIGIGLVNPTLPTVCTVAVSVFNDDGAIKSFELPDVPTDTVRYIQRGMSHFSGVLTNPCGDLMHAWAVMCCPHVVPTLLTELRGYHNIGFKIDAVRMEHTTVFVAEPPSEDIMP